MGRPPFSPRFQGRETLDGLLDLAGSPFETAQVKERFEEAVHQGASKSDVIPTLFESEPHFPDPSMAKQLYENLFGLWELVQSGRPVVLDRPAKAPRPEPISPPGPFGDSPDAGWIDRAWQYVDGLDGKSQARLMDAFENRQDALLSWLDEAGLSDEDYGQARERLFELWAMIQSGWPAGLSAARPGKAGAGVPDPLRTFLTEALFEEEVPEGSPIRPVVAAGLEALWNARH